MFANVVEDLTRARLGEENVNGLVARIRRVFEIFDHLKKKNENQIREPLKFWSDKIHGNGKIS